MSEAPSEYAVHVVAWGDGSAVPATGTDAIFVGTDAAGALHVRVFDAAGTRLRDADESQLADREEALAVVKERVAAWGPSHTLTDREELRLAREVLILVDLLRPVAPVLTVSADGTVTVGDPDRPAPSGPVLRVR